MAHYAHIFAFLLRRILDLAVEFGILRLQASLADLQALANGADRLDDILPHGRQLRVHLLDHRVVLRSRTQDPHPLQLQSVILRQPARQRCIRQAYIGRYQTVALGIVAQELIDIFHQAQLGLYLRHSALLGAAGMQKEACLSTYIRDVILLFVIRNGLLRFSQLFGDDGQPLVDKRCGIGSQHIFVHYRVEVVLLDDLVQQCFVALRQSRFGGQGDDIRFFFMQRYGDIFLVSRHYQFTSCVCDTVRGVSAQRAVGMNQDCSYAGLYRAAEVRYAGSGAMEEAHFCFHLVALLRRLHFDHKRFYLRILGQRQIVYRQCRIAELAFPS